MKIQFNIPQNNSKKELNVDFVSLLWMNFGQKARYPWAISGSILLCQRRPNQSCTPQASQGSATHISSNENSIQFPHEKHSKKVLNVDFVS